VAFEKTVHGSTGHDNLNVNAGGLKETNNFKEHVDMERWRVVVMKVLPRQNTSNIISHPGTGKAIDRVKRIRSTTKRNLKNDSEAEN
jgi:hypothetical protein